MPETEKQKALFSDFAAATAADWARKVQQDLKGENPESLHWQTAEGLTIKPCYHPEDLTRNVLTTAEPGQYPFVRGHHTANNQWQNTPEIIAEDNGHEAIARGMQALNQGADGLHFVVKQPAAFDLAHLIKNISFVKYPVSFTAAHRPAAFAHKLMQQLQDQEVPLSRVRGYICYNPTGTDEKYTPSYFDELKNLVLATQESADFKAVAVNGGYASAMGGTIIHEIAFTISAAVANLDELTKRGLDPAAVALNTQFRLAVGTNYFFEIAKLRVLRLLWANVLKAYNLDPALAGALRLHSETSRWHQTTFDPHSNLLRATTQAMAAVIGGCDSLTVRPFDITIRAENDFSERLARNLSIILKEEAYLHQSIDPAAGSYYLETLTSELADAAWQLFQDLEARGGFVKAWQSNTISEALHQSAQQKFKNIAAGTEVLVGTNKFINPQEKIDYDPEALIQSSYFDTTRAAYPFEVMRFAVEMHYRKRQQKPKAVIASIGEAIQRHINATFAKEFFTCAGFVTETQHFTSVAEAEAALHQVTANVMVMSASENEFETFARHFGPALRTHKDQPALILAANPQHMKEDLKAQGFDEFLFQGCDASAIVARIQERLLPNKKV